MGWGDLATGRWRVFGEGSGGLEAGLEGIPVVKRKECPTAPLVVGNIGFLLVGLRPQLDVAFIRVLSAEQNALHHFVLHGDPRAVRTSTKRETHLSGANLGAVRRLRWRWRHGGLAHTAANADAKRRAR
jgi:hypothetical protein